MSTLKKGAKVQHDVYSQERKDATLWAKSPEEADEVMRESCGNVWRKASKAEKDALYGYTRGSGGFNRPLRGYDQTWHNFKGVGKVDWNSEGCGEAIRHMMEVVEQI